MSAPSREDVVRWMAESGAKPADKRPTTYAGFVDVFLLVAEKAAAAEREACAVVCEEHPDGLNMLGGAFVTCAAAIRARGEQPAVAGGDE